MLWYLLIQGVAAQHPPDVKDVQACRRTDAERGVSSELHAKEDEWYPCGRPQQESIHTQHDPRWTESVQILLVECMHLLREGWPVQTARELGLEEVLAAASAFPCTLR